MPLGDSEIDRLAQAVMEEAGVDAEHIRAEALANTEVIRRQAKEAAEVEARGILERAALDAERIRRQGLAAAELKARMLHLEHREKLLKSVFEAARQHLPAVQQRSDYDQIALRLVREALFHLGAPSMQIHADPVTGQHLKPPPLETLAREFNAQLVLAEPLDQRLGVVVQTEDGRMHYDNTLDTRLARLQNSLRAEVNHILMGEAL
jgi:vacuolar-type H+-ATPase subunit E/Vma4